MVCPQCGSRAHRSHSRNFRETAVKSITPYKVYRCGDCGWRGMLARKKQDSTTVKRISMLIWLAGIITAMLISLFVARLFTTR
jgi:DNA-directed RNA polymerase subunit RPC12/RpoP